MLWIYNNCIANKVWVRKHKFDQVNVTSYINYVRFWSSVQNKFTDKHVLRKRQVVYISKSMNEYITISRTKLGAWFREVWTSTTMVVRVWLSLCYGWTPPFIHFLWLLWDQAGIPSSSSCLSEKDASEFFRGKWDGVWLATVCLSPSSLSKVSPQNNHDCQNNLTAVNSSRQTPQFSEVTHLFIILPFVAFNHNSCKNTWKTRRPNGSFCVCFPLLFFKENNNNDKNYHHHHHHHI